VVAALALAGAACAEGGTISESVQLSSSGAGEVAAGGATRGGGGQGGQGGSSNEIEVLAEGQSFPWGIGIAPGGVVWANRGQSTGAMADGSVTAWSEREGLRILAPAERAPDQVSARGGWVFFTSYVADGAVRRVPIAGGAPEDAAPQQVAPVGIASDDGGVYWSASDGSIRALTTSGEAVLVSGEVAPSLVAIDASNVYWTTFTDAGGVRGVSRAGGAPFDLAEGLDRAAGIAAMGDHVYFTAHGAGIVARVPIGGGVLEPIAAGQDGPAGLATDGAFVYWANMGAGTIVRAPVGGGEPALVAEGQGSPNGVAVDGEWVYWTNHMSGGSVSRRRKGALGQE
jgi:hypothetical protein